MEVSRKPETYSTDDSLPTAKPEPTANLLVTSLVGGSARVESHLHLVRADAQLSEPAGKSWTQDGQRQELDGTVRDKAEEAPDRNDKTNGCRLEWTKEASPRAARGSETAESGRDTTTKVPGDWRNKPEANDLVKCRCNCKSSPDLCGRSDWTRADIDNGLVGFCRVWNRANGDGQRQQQGTAEANCEHDPGKLLGDEREQLGRELGDDDHQSFCCERDTRLVRAHRRVECPWCSARKSHSIEGSRQNIKDSHPFGADLHEAGATGDEPHEMDHCCVCCCGLPIPSPANSQLTFSRTRN